MKSSKSGLWVLLGIVPIAGIIVFIFFFFDSQKGDNIYGADPKGRVPAAASTEASVEAASPPGTNA